MLTLLILGPKQPGNDIDIFLQPLIDDLKLLWDGVEVYDVVSKSNFNLRAVLIWTINDFPAYGNLAGCTMKGKTTCPICGKHTHSLWLYHSKKLVYMGHRRFLPPSHPYRRKKSRFDGKVENRQVPSIANGNAIDTQLKDFQNFFGKFDKKKRKRQKKFKGIWKKRSIFFDLPYWKELVLRHNLDVMHIEKNERIEQNRVASSSSIIDDAISRVLGPDQGYVKGLGFCVTLSKVSTSIQNDKTITSLENKCDNLTSDVDELKSVVASLLKDKEKTSDDNSNHLVKRVPSLAHIRTHTPTPIINSPPSVTTNTPYKCLLLGWIGSGEVIAEGRWSFNDPSVLVHHVPLGPNAVRVWVDTVKIPNSFLWRSTSDIIVIDDALGTIVAWPMDKVKLCD
ncbi:transposase [Cucumis melo var. makuwa]|uniref:Transposase n=1 Tax=Cucumis melo var. makuwa TaxID=1194695 RepID=A0A5A7UH01_CUCMM|nr:transposase [Cucumis melo var. makuwa]